MCRSRWMLALMAAMLSMIPVARAASSGPTYTSLLRVAFVSSTRGVGLFETASGRYPGRCLLYTRPTDDGGSSFGSRGAPLARMRCGTGAAFSTLTLSSDGVLFAYGKSLKVSHDLGRTWASAAISGGVASLVAHGHASWALVTRCRQTAQRCRLRLYRSTDRGDTWQTADSQPPANEVDGMAALAAEAGSAALLAVTPDGAPVLAVPTPPRKGVFSMPPTASVERLRPGSRRWTTYTVTCAGWNGELSIGFDGSYWLACAGEPGAGSQLKSLATSSNRGRTWRTIPAGCGITGSRCHSALDVAGYLGGLLALSSRTAFYVGDRSALAGTWDGGARWRTWQRVGGQDTGTVQVTFANPRDGWVVVQGSHYTSSSLWRTIDGGRTWSPA